MFRHVKSGRVNFCPGELFLKLLARIGEWHQNLSEKTAPAMKMLPYVTFVVFFQYSILLLVFSPCYRVRERDDKSYALSLSYKKVTKHYKIEKHKSSSCEKLAIEDGPRFDSLMDVSTFHSYP